MCHSIFPSWEETSNTVQQTYDLNDKQQQCHYVCSWKPIVNAKHKRNEEPNPVHFPLADQKVLVNEGVEPVEQTKWSHDEDCSKVEQVWHCAGFDDDPGQSAKSKENATASDNKGQCEARVALLVVIEVLDVARHPSQTTGNTLPCSTKGIVSCWRQSWHFVNMN